MAQNDEFARDGTVSGDAILDRILADDMVCSMLSIFR